MAGLEIDAVWLAVGILFFVALVVYLVKLLNSIKQENDELKVKIMLHKQELSEAEKAARKDSTNRQRAILKGQISETQSISAGLDYPGISPLHCFLKDARRARYTTASDEEALDAFKLVSKLENISPSLEPSHAFAEAIKLAPKLKKSTVIIVNSCGDSLKDRDIIKKKLGAYIR